MALHSSLLCMWFCTCCLNVQQRLEELFHTCTVSLAAACATICHQPDYTQRPDTTPLHECDWLDVWVASEGFPGNIWMDVSGFIVLLTHTNTGTHTHTHPAGHPSVYHSSSLWCESSAKVKRQIDNER